MPSNGSVGLILLALTASASAQPRLDFQAVRSLDDMKAYIRNAVPPGTARDAVRTRFVEEAGATLISHPTRPEVEKYLYDINLCRYYVWRWNISADFDGRGHALQIYVNGEPAIDGPAETFTPGPAPPGKRSTISKRARPRPEAAKGESSLAFILFDQDGDPGSIDDQQLIGGGPTQLDPLNMGKLHSYRVNPWRSIFDADQARSIVDYAGDCAVIDKAMVEAKG